MVDVTIGGNTNNTVMLTNTINCQIKSNFVVDSNSTSNSTSISISTSISDPSLIYSVDGSWAIMKISGNYNLSGGETLENAIFVNGYTDVSNLKIIGDGSNAVWNNFRFDYDASNGGKPDKLHIENIDVRCIILSVNPVSNNSLLIIIQSLYICINIFNINCI